MKRALQARSRGNLRSAVHRGALVVAPPAAAAGAWAAYWAAGWGPGGAGGAVRGAVLAWIGASLALLAVQGARRGHALEGDREPDTSPHPVRFVLGYAAVFSGYLIVVLLLVLVPVALVLSI